LLEIISADYCEQLFLKEPILHLIKSGLFGYYVATSSNLSLNLILYI